MNLHEVKWDNQKIGEFYNNVDILIQSKRKANSYFTNKAGEELLYYVNKHISIKNKIVLDYGCGMGDLTEILLKKHRPRKVYGCDLSSESIKHLNSRCKNYKNFGGGYVLPLDESFPYGSVDIVFGCEIIEHMYDNELDFFIRNAMACLRKGGYIVLSTPNEEDLTTHVVVCPDCGCYFHKSQHVRSWSAENLEKYLSKYGIITHSVVKKTLFSGVFTNRLVQKAVSWVYNNIFAFQKPRNMIYIGKKISEGEHDCNQ